MSVAVPPIYVDSRCLQDPQYQFRGIGHHVTSLLRNRSKSAASNCGVVALTNPNLPVMPQEYAQLFDEVTYCLNPSLPRRGSIFIHASPMTHDPSFSLRFVHHTSLLTASIVYDFIPLDWPGYLNDASQRIDYLSKLVRLRNSDLFLSISHCTSKRLSELTGARPDDILVTGAAIRSSFFDRAPALRHAARPATTGTPYFLMIGGGDPRKNTETVVRALCLINRSSSRQIRLRIVGRYSFDQKSDLQKIMMGNENSLEFLDEVDDSTLGDLYSDAIATIAPSYIEGFSLPVVEAAVCGSPVIASRCAAHLELLDQPAALFEAGNAEQLTERLTQLLASEDFRQNLILRQASLPSQFRDDLLGSRFWDFIMDRFGRRFHTRAPAVGKHLKPKIAFLSPYPPDQSGVARFTQLTVSAARRYFDIDLFTNAHRPVELEEGVRDLGQISIYPLLKNRYDSIVSVVGNSRFHIPVLDVFERYGGPCIMHDSRLTQIYFHRLGEEGFLEFARKLLGRHVERDEVRLWLDDRQPPSLFIEPLIERAKPVIVHTRRYQELLRQRYAFEAELATFPPTFEFKCEELSDGNRMVARHRLAIAGPVFAIASFGIVDHSKAAFACIVALDLLRFWGIPAELYFVGKASGLEYELRRVAKDYGVSEQVHYFSGFLPDEQYRDFLIGCDAALQLRTYDYGQPSAALADCISAGVPTVATCSLAESCDAPSYVARIPDHISALLIAERLAEIWEHRSGRWDAEDERFEHSRLHSFEYYAARLMEILNL